MLKLSDKIEIRADPASVFEWFAHLPDHYRAWHPDHVLCRFEGSEALRSGTRLYAEEYLHGRLHRLRLEITRVVPSKRVDYRIAPGLRGAFQSERAHGGTVFTAELELGFTWPVVGALVDRVLVAIFPSRIAALQQHMKEEGMNLKRILETAEARQ